MNRSCARPGCGQNAVATMSYAYAESVVVLEDLVAEAHPMVHDMCSLHAGSVRVPMGWELQDVRSGAPGAGDEVSSLRLVGA